MKKGIGEKIKALRVTKDITLQNLSEQTGLSTGFLSQLERGQTSPAIASLSKISQALNVELSYFFALPKKNARRIIRSYEQEVFHIDNSRFIYYNLTNDSECEHMTPFLINILPSKTEDITPYSHKGEEFIYVLEGILTMYINDQRHELYPGDSCHIQSDVPHDWANYTGKNVKILSINTPQIFDLPGKR